MPYKQHHLGDGSMKVLNSGLHPDLKTLATAATKYSPIDFTLTQGVRTTDQQFDLFQIGREYFDKTMTAQDRRAWRKVGRVVTNCDGFEIKSNHQIKADGFGHAIDVAAFIPGHPELAYDKTHLMTVIGSFLAIARFLHDAGKMQHEVRSGADWDFDTFLLEPGTFHDMPHIELIGQ